MSLLLGNLFPGRPFLIFIATPKAIPYNIVNLSEMVERVRKGLGEDE